MRCGSRHCTPHTISHQALEDILLEDLKSIFQNMDNLKELVEKQIAERAGIEREYEKKKELARALSELDRVRKRKKAVYEDYCEELISRDEFIVYRQDYMKKEEFLEKQLAYLKEEDEKECRDISEAPWIKHLLETKEAGCLDRNTVMVMLQEIKVYEEHKIKIIYNFAPESEKPKESEKREK